MTSPYGIVLTTVAQASDAQRLAHLLLEQHLAACVQVEPIHSYYRWQGQIHSDAEVRLVIKCRTEDYEAIEHYLQAQHPYDNPQILLLPIATGATAYLHWIDEVTR
jgi:periplasmic divalent cation tolerance protein